MNVNKQINSKGFIYGNNKPVNVVFWDKIKGIKLNDERAVSYSI